MAGTGNVGDTGYGHGQERGWPLKWEDYFPPIDYDRIENDARHWAKVAIDRCWVSDGDAPERGHWSDELEEDFHVLADKLTREYMQQSIMLVNPKNWALLMRDLQHPHNPWEEQQRQFLQWIMQSRHVAISTRFCRVCYWHLKVSFMEYFDFTGRLPRQTLPPAPQQPAQRRKEVM